MTFTKLVPNIYYPDIKTGLEIFIDCLEFTIGYNDLDGKDPCCVVTKDNLAVFLHQNKEYAEKDRPEFRLQTDNIEEVYAKVSASHPKLLHPNLKKPTLRPWGAKEFAMIDGSGVCVIVQEW